MPVEWILGGLTTAIGVMGSVVAFLFKIVQNNAIKCEEERIKEQIECQTRLDKAEAVRLEERKESKAELVAMQARIDTLYAKLIPPT